jgi:fluoroacetyl-CoA thioesterase
VSLEPGRTGHATLDVSEEDTAVAHGSGDVPVLATPRMIALCDAAAINAVDASMRPGETTVGMRTQVDHLAPTAVGGVVTAEATLERVEGRRLTFTVSVNDRCGLVAAGKVTRVVVDRERFLAKARG